MILRRFSIAAFICLAWPTFAFADAIVASWGGAYERAQWHGMFRDWSAQNGGQRLDFISGQNSAEALEAADRNGQVPWDLMDLERHSLDLACEAGLLKPLDLADYQPPNVSGQTETSLRDEFVSACGIPSVVWTRGLAVRRSRKLGATDVTLKSLFSARSKDLKLALYRGPEATLELTLLGIGVPPDRVYATLASNDGVNIALGHLSQLWKRLVWFERYEEGFSFLKRGQVDAALVYHDQVLPLTFADPSRWIFARGGHLPEAAYWAIPVNSPSDTRSQTLLKAATQPKAIAKTASLLGYSPAFRSVFSSLDPTLGQKLPGNPAFDTESLVYDASWWADNRDRVLPIFSLWFEDMSRSDGGNRVDSVNNPFLE